MPDSLAAISAAVIEGISEWMNSHSLLLKSTLAGEAEPTLRSTKQ